MGECNLPRCNSQTTPFNTAVPLGSEGIGEGGSVPLPRQPLSRVNYSDRSNVIATRYHGALPVSIPPRSPCKRFVRFDALMLNVACDCLGWYWVRAWCEGAGATMERRRKSQDILFSKVCNCDKVKQKIKNFNRRLSTSYEKRKLGTFEDF